MDLTIEFNELIFATYYEIDQEKDHYVAAIFRSPTNREDSIITLFSTSNKDLYALAITIMDEYEENKKYWL